MSQTQPRSAAAELVRLVGNLLYLGMLVVLAMLLWPVLLVIFLYRKYAYRDEA
jgi:hypothetical protein